MVSCVSFLCVSLLVCNRKYIFKLIPSREDKYVDQCCYPIKTLNTWVQEYLQVLVCNGQMNNINKKLWPPL